MTNYFMALLLTVAIELVVVLVARGLKPKLRKLPLPAACVCLNLLTHPLATIANLGLGIPLGVVELGVFVAEASGYRRIAGTPTVAAIVISFLANIFSVLTGWVAT